MRCEPRGIDPLGTDGAAGAAGMRIVVDGREIPARCGQTIAAALLAGGVRTFRQTRRGNAPRGLYCGMGICFDCLVAVDGRPNVRACVTPVEDGMRIETKPAGPERSAP